MNDIETMKSLNLISSSHFTLSHPSNEIITYQVVKVVGTPGGGVKLS